MIKTDINRPQKLISHLKGLDAVVIADISDATLVILMLRMLQNNAFITKMTLYGISRIFPILLQAGYRGYRELLLAGVDPTFV